MTRRTRWSRWWVAAVVAFCVAGGSAVVEAREGRIVAVADVHGSEEGLTTMLRETVLVDAKDRWIGGTATLVQTGDLLDRGLHVTDVMDLLMRLQKEAPQRGGRVVCLLGNHEAMNLFGLVRDVNPDIYAGFVTDASEQRRKAAYEQDRQCRKARQTLLGMKPVIQTWEQWVERYPLGKLEYLESLGPDGRYGRWLRTLPVAARIKKTLFVHGGISPRLISTTVFELNHLAAAEIEQMDQWRSALVSRGLVLPTAPLTEVRDVAAAVIKVSEDAEGKQGRMLRSLARKVEGIDGIGGWLLIHPYGPLWFRGAARWTKAERGAAIAEVLDELRVDRMVIGHTVMSRGRINSRFGGRVIALDTGMLSEVYEGGRPSALEIKGDVVTAVYPGERFRLVDGVFRAEADPAVAE